MRVDIGRQQFLTDDDRGQQERDRPQAEGCKPEEVHRLGRIAAEQLYRDQVEHHPRRACE